MDKKDFFLLCMQQGKFKSKPWVLRAFSLVQETKTVENIGFYDILQTPAGFFYKSPETNGLEPITGIESGKPMFTSQDPITVKKGTLPGFVKDEDTKIGRVLYHCIVFVYPFDDKVEFTNKQLNMGAFEDRVAANFEDDVQEGQTELRNKFYPRELVRYYEAVAYSRGLAMLFVPAASPKSMTIDPKVLKRRDELFSDPKINLDDQAQAAAVEMELVEMDKKSFEGDSASGFLINKKDFAVIRKKRFISFGSGAGLTPDSRTKYVKRSLDDGVDIDNFKSYNDEMRSGSYKRGVETMFGGELDKWLVRESSNIRVIPENCGTTVGLPDMVTEFNKVSMIGTNIVSGKGFVTLTEDNIGTYLGKAIFRRSPAACWGKAPDYCAVCLGSRLSMNPDAISIAFSQYGHDFMGESMSAMHGKSLSVARMDLFQEAS